MITSMNRLVAVAALATPLFFAACGGSSSSTPKDMAVASMDQAVSVDQSAGDAGKVYGTMACSDVLTCAEGCSGSAAATATCVTACVNSGSEDGQNKFQALLMCGYQMCIGKTFDLGGSTDGGETGCVDANDQTAGCESCVHSAAVTQCPTQFDACFM